MKALPYGHFGFNALLIDERRDLAGFFGFVFHMNIHLLYDCPHLHDSGITMLCSGTWLIVKTASL